jgi:cytochrome P450
MELFDPTSSDWLANKHTAYAQLNDRNDFYFCEKHNGYVVTEFNDVMTVLKTPQVFSSAKGNLVVEHDVRFGNTLGASDSPVHEKLKASIVAGYAKERMGALADCFENNFTIQPNLSEALEVAGSYVLDDLLGFPFNCQDLILDKLQNGEGNIFGSNYREPSFQMVSLLKLAVIRKMPANRDGLYKEYIKLSYADRQPTLLFGPTASGIQSMVGALQLMTWDLSQNPEEFAKIKADRTLIEPAINECLRFNPSAARFSRTATQDFALSKGVVKQGDRVLICLDAANRDGSVFVDPDKFDINREKKSNLGFGFGMHACIALAVSKAVMERYLNILLDSFDSIQLKTTAPTYVATASGNFDLVNNLEM